jgi:hypothetical protein
LFILIIAVEMIINKLGNGVQNVAILFGKFFDCSISIKNLVL